MAGLFVRQLTKNQDDKTGGQVTLHRLVADTTYVTKQLNV